jgi:hypothetical protein
VMECTECSGTPVTPVSRLNRFQNGGKFNAYFVIAFLRRRR